MVCSLFAIVARGNCVHREHRDYLLYFGGYDVHDQLLIAAKHTRVSPWFSIANQHGDTG